ncbi:MAG: response regulator [Pseudomonadota bacterium]
MAGEGFTFRQSMTAKLIMLCFLIFLVFGGIVAIMFSAFNDIEKLTTTSVSRDVSRIIENAQMSRDLSRVLTDTNLLVSTFYGHGEVLVKAKEGISSATEEILAKNMDEIQRAGLKDLSTALSLLFEQCVMMNTLQGQILAIDGSLHHILDQLEENVSRKLVDLALAGDNPSVYEQIGALIPSYRESLLRITLSFSSLEPAQDSNHDLSSIIDLLDNLHLRLRTLLALDSEVAAYGEKSLAKVVSYRKNIVDFQREKAEMYRRLTVLDGAKERTLKSMKTTDMQSVDAVHLMEKEITDITSSSANFVLSISATVVMLFAFFTYVFLFGHIRMPMESIRRSIVAVGAGDLQARVQLGRKDEWNVIEKALNWMIEELGSSYDRLKNNHEELTKAHSQMSENLLALESEIRQRRQAEKEMEKLQQQLLHAQKMEAIGTLAGGVAHDFNNLLQGVQGYTELLLLKAGGQNTRELQEILRAAKRGGELTRQLLTFSRKVKSNLVPVDLNQVISGLRDLLERTIPKMIKVTLHLKSNLDFVNADASQIEQVLMNLAVNARDAMPDGGHLTIGTEDIVMDVRYNTVLPEMVPGPYVLLAVSDTGQGMDQETQNRIFDPFFTTKAIGKGTGLGLAIVYGIVKNHKGHIVCYSEPAKGTTFKIYLPAIQHLQTAILGEAAEELPRGTETILLVDDESFIRDIGRQILTEFGYTVLSATDGESALEIYEREKEKIALIILDIIMPGMGGEQCLKKMVERHSPVKVIIASGYSASSLLGNIVGSGAADFIDKPYDVGKMLRTIRRVLDGEKTS